MARAQAASKQQRREDMQRWLRSLALLLALSAVVVAMVLLGRWLMEPDTLPLTRVRVITPLQSVARDELREVLLPHAEAGFLALDMNAAREALETLPWVRKASLRRRWPDTLEVEVEEHQALALWNRSEVVNTYGELFESARRPEGLPQFFGPKGSESKLVASYHDMQRMLEPLTLQVRTLRLSERRAWSLELDNGLELLLGRDDEVARLLRFVRVYPQVLRSQAQGIEWVDLRYTNGFAIRWRAGFAPGAA